MTVEGSIGLALRCFGYDCNVSNEISEGILNDNEIFNLPNVWATYIIYPFITNHVQFTFQVIRVMVAGASLLLNQDRKISGLVALLTRDSIRIMAIIHSRIAITIYKME